MTPRRAIFVFFALAAALWPLAALAQGAPGGESTPLRNVSTFALWSIFGGAITSGASAIINQAHWPSPLKLGVFLALCCITAGINAQINGNLDLHDWSRSLALVITAGWTTYLASRPAMQSIEKSTTITKPTSGG